MARRQRPDAGASYGNGPRPGCKDWDFGPRRATVEPSRHDQTARPRRMPSWRSSPLLPGSNRLACSMRPSAAATGRSIRPPRPIKALSASNSPCTAAAWSALFGSAPYSQSRSVKRTCMPHCRGTLPVETSMSVWFHADGSAPASRMTLATSTILSGKMPRRTGFSATSSKSVGFRK
jgi:hypothetical protein